MTKPSCKSTAFKRLTAIKMRWNKNWGSLSFPRSSPTQIVQKRSVRFIDRSRSRSAGSYSESAKWHISPLCERLPSAPHSQDPARRDQCKSRPWSKQLSRPTSWTCRLQKESTWRHSGFLPSWRTKPTCSLATGSPAATKARATRSFSIVTSRHSASSLFADKAVRVASVDRRAASAKAGTQVQPKRLRFVICLKSFLCM